MNTPHFSIEAMAHVVAQGAALDEGLVLADVPWAALCQVADELELLALACRSKRLKGVKVIGAMVRMVDRLEVAEQLVPAPRVTAVRYAIDLLINATPSHEFVDLGLRLALRGLVREARSHARLYARSQARRASAAAANDESTAEAAE